MPDPILTPAENALLAALLLASFVIGFWERKRVTLDEYWVNARSTGTFTLTATMLSTFLGAGTFLALAQVAFVGGVAAFILGLSFTFYFAIFALLLAPRIHRMGTRWNAYTLPDILTVRYGPRAGIAAAAVTLVIFALFLAEQFVGAGAFVSHVAGIPLNVATVAGGGVIVLYTAVGGLRADIRTDVFQFLIMLAMLLVFLPFLWFKGGGVETLRTVPPDVLNGTAFLSPVMMVAGFLTFGMTTMVSMDVWQRAFSARDERVVRRGMMNAALLTFPFFLLATLMGLFARALFPDIADPNLFVPMELQTFLPVGLRGLVIAGFVAAILSTADTCLLIVSQTLVHDLYNRRRANPLPPERILRLTRRMTAILGTGALILAITVLSIFHLAVSAVTFAVSLIPATLAAFFWKRATASGAFWSIATGALVILVCLPLIGEESFLPGILASAAVLGAVSVYTRHGKSERIDALEVRS